MGIAIKNECSTNQSTSFYIIDTSVMKELKLDKINGEKLRRIISNE